MRRSITYFGMTLGTAALIALTGCRREPQQPPPTGPTGEPTAPGAPGATAPQPGAQTTQPGPPSSEYGAGLPGEAGQPGQAQGQAPGTEAQPGQPQAQPGQPQAQPGQPQAQPPSTGEPTATAGGNEREMCDALSSAAKLHVEDVQNGTAIVMVPRQGTTLSNLRDDAHRVQQSIQQHAQPQAGGEACGIFALGRLPSVNTSVSEGKSSVRIVMTTSNPSEVRDLRRMAREQVGMLMKGPQGNPQHQR